jgi:hypothetical protein
VGPRSGATTPAEYKRSRSCGSFSRAPHRDRASRPTANQRRCSPRRRRGSPRTRVIVRAGFDRPEILAFAVPLRTARGAPPGAFLSDPTRRGCANGRVRAARSFYCSTRKTPSASRPSCGSGGGSRRPLSRGRAALAPRAQHHTRFEAGRQRACSCPTNAFGLGSTCPTSRLIAHFPGARQRRGLLPRSRPRRAATRVPLARAGYSAAFGSRPSGRLAARVLRARRSPGSAPIRSRDRALSVRRRAADSRRSSRHAFHGRASGDPCREDADVVVPEQRDAGRCRAPPRPARVGSSPQAPRGGAPRSCPLRAAGQITRPVGKTTSRARCAAASAAGRSRAGGLLREVRSTVRSRSTAGAVAGGDRRAEPRDGACGAVPAANTPPSGCRAGPVRYRRARTGGRRAARTRSAAHWAAPIARAPRHYRRRQARALRWKTYWCSQHSVILRDRPREGGFAAPRSRISPARAGEVSSASRHDIRSLVRRHRATEPR